MNNYVTPAQCIGYQRTELNNGIRVVSETLPSIYSATVGVWIGCGSRHDPAGLEGQAHFLEHMLYKDGGTATDSKIIKLQEQLGGYANAFTSYENTCFYISFVGSDLEVGLDLLEHLVTQTSFDPGDIERERSVVLAEINREKDAPKELARQMSVRAAWGEHAMVRPILGHPHSVLAVTQRSLLDYRDRAFVAPNIAVAAAGNVDHDLLASEITRRFSAYPQAAPPPDGVAPVFKSGFCAQSLTSKQVYLSIALPGTSEGSADFAYLNLFAKLLGGGMGSRLGRRIREESGLAYRIHCSAMACSDGGLLLIQTAVAPELVDECLEQVMTELQTGIERGFTDYEISVACKHLMASIVLGIENSRSRMVRLGRMELCHGQFMGPDKIIETLGAIRPDDYNAWVRRNVKMQIAMGAIGPAPALDALEAKAEKWLN